METKFPTETVELPSQGRLYPKESPLHTGKIEMRYMTAKDEDILTNQNYLEKGTVVDKLLQSLIVDKDINYNDILVGDKNALLVAARIMGYGAKYEFPWRGEKQVVDLSEMQNKPLSEDFLKATENRFSFVCPSSGTVIEFKLLNGTDEQAIEREIKGVKKMTKGSSPELSTRLKYMILSVDGETDRQVVRRFVDERFLARDSREFRNYVVDLQPDIDMRFYPEDGPEEGVTLPITVGFLWPDANLE